jgi:hypothetical protein
MTALNRPHFYARCFYMLLLMSLWCSGCGDREQPPFFTALVTDIWNQTQQVENFKIVYQWEERGETPFLKPYAYHAKELIIEVMVPLPGDSHRVDIVTRKIPFRSIKQFEFIRGQVTNTIKILMKNDEEILATDRFPQSLKKGIKTGFADYATRVEGTVVTAGKQEKFKADLYNIKKAVIIKETM